MSWTKALVIHHELALEQFLLVWLVDHGFDQGHGLGMTKAQARDAALKASLTVEIGPEDFTDRIYLKGVLKATLRTHKVGNAIQTDVTLTAPLHKLQCTIKVEE